MPLENVLSASPGLYDHLVWQLHLSSCPPSCSRSASSSSATSTMTASWSPRTRRSCGRPGLMRKSSPWLSAHRARAGPSRHRRAVAQGLPAGAARPSRREQQHRRRRGRAPGQGSPSRGGVVGPTSSTSAGIRSRGSSVATSPSCAACARRHPPAASPSRAGSTTTDRNVYIEPDVYVREVDGELRHRAQRRRAAPVAHQPPLHAHARGESPRRRRRRATCATR